MPFPTASLSRPAAVRHGSWGHSLALAAAAFGLFLLLPQRTLHGVDGNVFAVWIESGFRGYARHVGYLHFCGLVHAVLGGSGFQSLRVASALGTALGLLCLHRAVVRMPLGSLRSSLLPVVAVLLTPAWFFYATSAETAGVFAAGVGAAWWAFARWIDAPNVARAAVLGLATAFAGSLHSFGHVLLPSFVLIAVAWRQVPANRPWRQLAVALATHTALALAASRLLGGGAGEQTADAFGYLRESWARFAPATAPVVFWREWVVPYLPWSIAALIALAVPRARPWGTAVLVLLAVHLPIAVLLLGAIDVDEGGAYLLALAPPAALAAAHLVRAPRFAAYVVAGALLAGFVAAPGWRDPISPEFSAGVAELYLDRRPALVVIGDAELNGARAVPGAVAMRLGDVIGAFMQTRAPDTTFAAFFDQWLANLHGQQLPVLLTDATCDFFADGPDAGLRSFWRNHVLQRYRVRPEQRRGFRGFWIEPK